MRFITWSSAFLKKVCVMIKKCFLAALVACSTVTVSNAEIIVYDNNFDAGVAIGAPGDPFNTAGWGGYVERLGSVGSTTYTVTDESAKDPERGNQNATDANAVGGISSGNATANNYLFMAPKTEEDSASAVVGNTAAGVESLMFSTDSPPVDVADLLSITVGQSFDGAAGLEGKGRFAIELGGSWYASEYNWTSDNETGTTYTTELLTGIDFADGSNWRTLSATVGSAGIDLGGAAVGGTLSGDVTSFGVYAEHGNGGDHVRIDDFSVSAVSVVPEPGSFSIVMAIGGSLLAVRRRS